MCDADGGEEENKCRSFLARFDVVEVSLEIAEKTVRIRCEHRIKLPDAIIWATA